MSSPRPQRLREVIHSDLIRHVTHYPRYDKYNCQHRFERFPTLF